MCKAELPGEIKDRLVNAVTAFDTWDELKAALDGGYVPTLRGETENERKLICLLLAEGYRAWGNKGRNW
ncbi:hypothetical protein GobsT_37880 [Gemmata obscuriglobus]|uniref:Uncharacterized protein n=1 Tax=Gemmata obscuriglobus TaxID=114 RepID=A0A2Z3GXK2_9BACT|nr:hypothetical protein [Gemmata obscuriglobus]AWM38118.1 hypothetical protein C1280_14695 [Gemmata obscuriglobus]QEG28999.1 hypothetical protein GobsT_37880 [Gemmata obscuriglobus]VTS07573.1 unnamed protein product [Gemmata obscuriglobus UQM 2246]